MIFNSGTKNTAILEKYISDIDCKTCETKTEHFLVIYCKTFVFGLFYPLKWWAWDKQGYMKCKKCGRQSVVAENNLNLPPKVYNYFRQTKIPFRYKFPLIAALGTLVLIGLLIIGGFFTAVISAITPVQNKIVGSWRDDFNVSYLYVYKDNKYTYVASDTVIFGNYTKNHGKIDFLFYGKDNIITNLNVPPLILENDKNGRKTFHKSSKKEPNNLYRKEKNNWRIPPEHKETNEEIRKRILEMLAFEESRFKNAIDNKEDFVAEDPNSPIYFAVNGFAVKDETMLKWRYIFYDSDDCEKANRLIQKEFPKEFKADSDTPTFIMTDSFLKLFIEKIKKADLKFLDTPDQTVYE